MDAHVLLGPPFEVEGEIVRCGGRNLPVADDVVVTEQRADALGHRALLPPARVEPVAYKGVEPLRVHDIDRILRECELLLTKTLKKFSFNVLHL